MTDWLVVGVVCESVENPNFKIQVEKVNAEGVFYCALPGQSGGDYYWTGFKNFVKLYKPVYTVEGFEV